MASLLLQTLLEMLLCQHRCHHICCGQCRPGETCHLKVRTCLHARGQQGCAMMVHEFTLPYGLYWLYTCTCTRTQEEELKKSLLMVFANKQVYAVHVYFLTLFSFSLSLSPSLSRSLPFCLHVISVDPSFSFMKYITSIGYRGCHDSI